MNLISQHNIACDGKMNKVGKTKLPLQELLKLEDTEWLQQKHQAWLLPDQQSK